MPLKAISNDFLIRNQFENLWQWGDIGARHQYKFSLTPPDAMENQNWQLVSELAEVPGFLQKYHAQFKMTHDNKDEDEAWELFGLIFDLVGQFLENMECFVGYFKDILKVAVADGLQFLEIRATFSEVRNWHTFKV